MNTTTVAFLVIGAVGLALLLVSLVLDDLVAMFSTVVSGPISVPATAGFLGAFGFAGAIATQVADAGPVTAALIGGGAGLAAAVPFTWLVVRASRATERMHTDATPTRADLVGRIGVVVTPIPADGYGEIRIGLGGAPMKLNARSAAPVPLGAQIFVIETLSETSVLVEQTTFVL